ncbi:MAG TPA: adenylate kinase family protein [Geobacterales bacterium]|nr:adenylate kinase family protein [Geobacterales bacterium]
MKILICGTPGTGKTTLSLFLSSKGFHYINYNTFAFFSRSILKYDKVRKSYVVNSNKIYRKLGPILKSLDKVVLDSHIIAGLPKKFDLIVVLRCDPEILRKRLMKKYGAKKMKENIEAEILGILSHECKKKFRDVREVKTTNIIDAKKGLYSLIMNPRSKIYTRHIDWADVYEKKNALESLYYFINS